MEEKRCAHCACLLDLNPRSKNQRYCGERECQRARKRAWQKNRMAAEPSLFLKVMRTQKEEKEAERLRAGPEGVAADE